MKKNILHCLFLALLLSAVAARCQQLAIDPGNGKQTVVTKTDLDSMPHVKVVTHDHDSDKPVTYEGVALGAVLEKAGVELGHSLRGSRLASCLLVETADGYRAVIALPELDPDSTDKQIVLAFSQDGKPLDEHSGPYRIVIPDEKRMARWVKQVTRLKIVQVQ